MIILHCFGIMNRSGAETMLMNIYRKIRKEKYKFIFLVHMEQKGDYDEEIYELGGSIYKTQSLGKVGLIKYILNFKKVVKEMPYIDIVHIHMDWQCGYIALAARLAGIKNIIAHSHTYGFSNFNNFKNKIAVMFSKKLIPFLVKDKFACSEEAGRDLYGENKYKIINNAINYSIFSCVTEDDRKKIRSKLRIKDNDILICNIGKLCDNKNQIFILGILRELLKYRDNYKLILIGKGDRFYNNEIAEVIKKFNIESYVRLLGVQKEIPKYLNASDVFILPSIEEGFGMVAVEAQAMGLQCLLSDNVPRKVDIDLGLTHFISLKNKEKWINNIKMFKSKKIEKGKIEIALKKNNLEINEQVKNIEKIYESVN